MHVQYDFSKLMDEGRTVYVRSVRAEDLPEDVQEQVGEQDTLYAVHRADGTRFD